MIRVDMDVTLLTQPRLHSWLAGYGVFWVQQQKVMVVANEAVSQPFQRLTRKGGGEM